MQYLTLTTVRDNLAVLRKINNAWKSGTLLTVKEYRIKAVDELAKPEPRFKNDISADGTIHDGFARRLSPDIIGRPQFDSIAEEWLRTGSTRLKNILLKHAADLVVEREVKNFFTEEGVSRKVESACNT